MTWMRKAMNSHHQNRHPPTSTIDLFIAGIAAGLLYGSCDFYSTVITPAKEWTEISIATPATSDTPAGGSPPSTTAGNLIHLFIAPPKKSTIPLPAMDPPKVTQKNLGSAANKVQVSPRLEKSMAQNGVTKAWQALVAGRLDEAKSLYRQTLKIQAHNQDAMLGLAVVLHRQGERDDAWKIYREVLGRSPNNATAVTGMMTLLGEFNPSDAENHLKQFIENYPNEDLPRVALGHLLAKQNRWSEAHIAFFGAYTLQPRSASNNYHLAVALDKLYQYGQALDFYRAALEGTGLQDIPVESIRQRIKTLSARGMSQP